MEASVNEAVMNIDDAMDEVEKISNHPGTNEAAKSHLDAAEDFLQKAREELLRAESV